MKIATIGTGFIVEAFIQATTQVEGAEVVAVYSRKKESGQGLADKFHINTIYIDLEAMLEDPSIDTIYVASPNSLHFEHSKQALLANKNVICEKPFTSTVKELNELIALSKQQHRFLFEAIVTIHMPNYLLIEQNIERLGSIRMVQCNFSQYSSRYDKFLAGETPNVFNPEFSGGALADINIYNLHFVMHMFGKPKSFHYEANIQKGIDTSGVLILEYDGFKAVCVGCKDTRSQNISQIQGELGYITLNSETSRCASFSITTKDGTQMPSMNQQENALYYELLDFVRIIDSQDYVSCERMLKYSLDVLTVYEAARKQAGIHFPADDK